MGGAGVCLPKGSTLFPRLTCPPPPLPPPTDSVKSSSSEHLGVASWPLVYLAVSPRPPHLFHFEGIQARNGTSVPRTEHQTPSTRRRPSSVQLPAQPPGSWRRPPSALPASALAPPGGQCGVRTALLDWRRPPQPSRDPDSRPPSSHYIGLSLPASLLHPRLTRMASLQGRLMGKEIIRKLILSCHFPVAHAVKAAVVLILSGS